MKCLMKIILLNCVLLQAIISVKATPQNVAKLFFGPSLATRNPVVSMGCFSDYILKSKPINERYSQDYNKCLLEAKADRQATDDRMLDKRSAIAESSHEISKRLSMCDSLNNTLEVFHCHSLIGANNTKDVYTISGNASEYATVLQENYRQIDLRHELCCKMSERKYVGATGINYRELQSCLEGRTKPSSPTATRPTTPANILNTPKDGLDSDTSVLGATETEVYPGNSDTTTLKPPAVENTTL